MLVRLLVGLSGSEYSLGPGDERDFPDDEAIRLIEREIAVPVAERTVEKTVKRPVVERRTRKSA